MSKPIKGGCGGWDLTADTLGAARENLELDLIWII